MTTDHRVNHVSSSTSPREGPGAGTIVIDPVHPDPHILLRAADIIRRGGVVAHPTETFYGLATDPFNDEGIARIYEMKGRPHDRSLILLVARVEQVFDLAIAPGTARVWLDKLARAFWPGPLSLVLPVRPRLSCPALSGAATVALRVPSHPVAWQLARTAGGPITSTSANVTGAPPANSAAGLDKALSARLDITLDGGVTPGGSGSTLLDLSDARPRILRAGNVAADSIAAVLGLRPMEKPVS